MLVLRCGYKPSWSVAAGALHNMEELTAMKRDPNLEFSLPSGSNRHYSHHVATARKDIRWNTVNPEGLLDYFANVTYRAKRQARDKRMIRSFHAAHR